MCIRDSYNIQRTVFRVLQYGSRDFETRRAGRRLRARAAAAGERESLFGERDDDCAVAQIRQMAAFASGPVHGAASRAHNAAYDAAEAVSYTHLDVYKRQGHVYDHVRPAAFLL